MIVVRSPSITHYWLHECCNGNTRYLASSDLWVRNPPHAFLPLSPLLGVGLTLRYRPCRLDIWVILHCSLLSSVVTLFKRYFTKWGITLPTVAATYPLRRGRSLRSLWQYIFMLSTRGGSPQVGPATRSPHLTLMLVTYFSEMDGPSPLLEIDSGYRATHVEGVACLSGPP